jgi:SAM-dependent methyltransferase
MVMSLHRLVAEFDAVGEAYERGRPSYPQAAIDLLAAELGLGPGRDAVDLAAGTGKLTRLLLETGARVVAVEPVGGMRRVVRTVLPAVPVLDSTAERIPLPGAAADAVLVGQAFHWFDAAAALAEIARVLRPGGGLALLFNARDEAHGWLGEVTRLLDVHERGAPRHRTRSGRPAFDASRDFAPLRSRRFPYRHRSTLTGQRDRFASVSFVAALPAAERDALLDEIDAVMAPHAERDGGLTVPYQTDVFWTTRT